MYNECKCEKYLCLWNRIYNLITYYQNIIILHPELSDEQVKAIDNIINMLLDKKRVVESIMDSLGCFTTAKNSDVKEQKGGTK